MDFNRQWTAFALDAEVEHFGTSRIAAAHNALRAEVERLTMERDRYHDALIARHGGEPVALLAELDEARAEVERLRGLLREARDKWILSVATPHATHLSERIDAALAKEKP